MLFRSGPLPPGVLPKSLAGDTSFAGEWTGRVALARGAVPVRWIVAPDGSARGVVGADTLAAARSPEVSGDGLLEARIAGALPLAETAGQPQVLGLKLRRVGPVLAGYVSAQVRLGERPFLMLPFPVCLWRTQHGATVDRTLPPACTMSE